eukprot:11044272-Ditylum_brightwellii.AAC.1
MVANTYEPVLDGSVDNYFISALFDGLLHFQNDVHGMLYLYKHVTGKELDMDINADSVEVGY